MTNGERAAFEGVLSFLKPRLAVEVGSAAGGSLLRIAAHSRQVHSFDGAQLAYEVTNLALAGSETVPNIVFHIGDTHQTLAPWMKIAAYAGVTVDFAHIDGDHTAKGVAKDITDILDSPAFDGVMLLHDASNPEVRAGMDLADFEHYPHVVYVDYDFIPGRLAKRAPLYPNECDEVWGGFGLVVADRSHQFKPNKDWVLNGIRQDRFCSIDELRGSSLQWAK